MITVTRSRRRASREALDEYHESLQADLVDEQVAESARRLAVETAEAEAQLALEEWYTCPYSGTFDFDRDDFHIESVQCTV